MGTNFYLKKDNETKKLVEEKFKFMLLEDLNKILPRERHAYLIKFFNLTTNIVSKEMLRELGYGNVSTKPFIERLNEEKEKHEKYVPILIGFCRKKEITFGDLDLINELIDEKIQSFSEKEGYHIGKRSAAGSYCKKCNVTLCDEGFAGIHSADSGTYDKCPICNSDANVGYVCSFTWQWSKNFWMDIFCELDEAIILDEYEDKFTIHEFLTVELQGVPFNMQAEEKEHVFS